MPPSARISCNGVVGRSLIPIHHDDMGPLAGEENSQGSTVANGLILKLEVGLARRRRSRPADPPFDLDRERGPALRRAGSSPLIFTRLGTRSSLDDGQASLLPGSSERSRKR